MVKCVKGEVCRYCAIRKGDCIMSLPFPPQLTGDDHTDIMKIHDYLFSLLDDFDNAAGQAIDPSMGQGGDGSLTIVDIPGDIVYTPSSSLSVDGTLFGSIEIEYTIPDND